MTDQVRKDAGTKPPQPAVPITASTEYYVAHGKVKEGPFSLVQLQSAARAGTLRAADMVLPAGTQKWRAASEIPGLFPAPPHAPPGAVAASAVRPASLFISYRRADSPDTVKLIHERLKQRLPRWEIFYDHESIPLGEQFPDLLRLKVTTATAVLVIIGPRWLEILHQRKSAAIDHVREEVRLALEAGASVVPVLVGHATMPTDADLADCADLQPLLQRNGRPIRPDPDFSSDLERIITFLKPLDADVAIGTILADKYTLTAEIGVGGMGVVFKAQQKRPVKRTVAVKLIKPGMDSRDVLARFDAERQALAVMDHPNIAKVLDAGMADSGRPFFVMEYVKGVPITQHCDENKLTPQERLNLFISVCNAVQHAHQKGILHRDIKPSNVLVEVVDGKPVPKVIDFGLAKATGQQLTDMTQHTTAGTRVGTLEYSAPEQAAGSFDIDTRSDIYSLGVLLYELLTGAPPFTRAQLLKIGEDEMKRVIREDEPVKPSKRLSSSGELPAIATNRHLEPAKLTRMVQGDLDWIVMKCLEKERGRRYKNASDIGDELQRFLADEPVQACPPSAGYRMKKFLRRNKGPAIAAALVFLALIAGIIGTSIGLVQAQWARERADKATDAEKLATQKALDAAEANKLLAQAEKLATQKALDTAEANKLLAQEETKSRKTAEDATKSAIAARNAAEDEKKQKEKQLDRAELLVYAGKLSLAQSAFWEGNGALALQYLDECQWNLRGWEHLHLWTRFSSKQNFLGHTGEVTSVAFSADGKRIVSGSGDYTVKVWDAATGDELLTPMRHARRVSGVAFSADGKRIVSGSWDGTVKVWDADTGKEVLTLKGQKGQEGHVNSVAISADGKRIVAGIDDGTVKVWDAETGQEILTFDGSTTIWDRGVAFKFGVKSVAFSADGKRIVSGARDGDNTVKVWDAATGKELLTLKGHSDLANSVAFSADGKRIVSGSEDGTVKLWDADKGGEVLTLKAHTDHQVNSVAISADGKRIVSGSGNNLAKTGGLKVWDSDKGQEVFTLKGHTGMVTSVAFSADGKRIVSGSGNDVGKPGEVKVWDADRGQEILTLKGHADHPVNCVAISADGKRIVSGGIDSWVKVWDADKGAETRTLKGHAGVFHRVALSADGKRIVSSWHSMVKLWDADKGQEIRTLKGHTLFVASVAFSADGKHIVSGAWDKTVKVWDADTGKELLTLNGHTDFVFSVAFSADGKRIVSGSGSGGEDGVVKPGEVKVWDADRGQEILTLKGHTGTVASVAFSADGKHIVSGAWDKTVKVWDADTGKELLTLNGHTGKVNSVAFSADGKRVVSGSQDQTVRVWDADKGQEVLTLKEYSGEVSSVAFSADGKRLVSGYGYGRGYKTLIVWEADKGQEVFTLKGDTDEVSSVAWSVDGKRIVAKNEKGGIRSWDALKGQEVIPCIDPPPPDLQREAGSPDGKLRIWAEGTNVRVVRNNAAEAERWRKEHAAGFVNRGNAWYGKKEYDKAIADYNEAIRLDPKNVLAYVIRGNAWHDKKEYDQAIADYTEAICLDPKDVGAYVDRGNAWHDKKEYDKAIADYTEAIRLDPKDVLVYVDRGRAWNEKKDYDKAIADYNDALRLDSKNVLAYTNRGIAFANKKDYDKALGDFKEALRLDASNDLAIRWRDKVIGLKEKNN